MAKIGTIAIDLVAHTGKLLAPLRRAEAGIAALASKATMFTSILAPLGGMVTGFITVAAAVSKMAKAFSELDSIAKESDRLGISTEKLIGLQLAAGMAGVEAETLGKSLQFLMKSGGDIKDLDEIADTLSFCSSINK